MEPLLPAIIIAASSVFGELSPAEAEKAYWDCEFAAIHGAIGLDEAAACSEIFEDLKSDKFRGDFRRFLVWWQENKDRELSSRTKPRQRGQEP
jgi:hypothetical protein